jgi:hypothetical protein
MAQPQIRPTQLPVPLARGSARFDGAQILRVVGTSTERPDALVVTAHSGPAEPWCVRCALPPNVVVTAGDEVVVLSSSEGPVAIARLRSPEAPQQTALADGTRIQSDATSIVVERADGTPLFQYSAQAGVGTVTLAAEAMHIAASAGDLKLSAAGEIHMRGRTLSLRSSMPDTQSGLEISPRQTLLSSQTLALAGESFKLEAGEAELNGGELRSTFKRAVITLSRLESSAEVVVSRARNVYQSVQELLQQEAGTLRTLVAGSAQLKAREVAHRAEEAYKIRAEKIHLG